MGRERQVELGEWEGRDYHISLYTSMKFLKVKKKILKLPISLKKKNFRLHYFLNVHNSCIFIQFCLVSNTHGWDVPFKCFLLDYRN